MNQILDKKSTQLQATSANVSSPSKKKFLFIFFISISICILCFFIYVSMKYHLWEKEKISQSLVEQFSITTLYANSTSDGIATPLSTISSSNSSEPFVIGLIEIERIKLLYPILSNTTEELLKIAPCRYAGPMPNQVR